MLADMNVPRPSRRWLQFSLRALLVFVTLCALACSWLAVKLRETQREEAAAAAIEKVGGTAAWDAKLSGPAWLRSLLGEHVFGNVTNVVLHGDKLSDTALEPLYSLNHLQRLDLSFANITDADIEHLQRLRQLKGLFLETPEVTDAAFEKLSGLDKLEELELHATRITDAGLGKLTGLNQIRALALYDANVNDTALENLQRMTKLTYVYLYKTHVTAAGVKKLQQALPNCKIQFVP